MFTKAIGNKTGLEVAGIFDTVFNESAEELKKQLSEFTATLETQAIYHVADLISSLANRANTKPSDDATSLVIDIIHNSSYFHFAGSIVFFVRHPERELFKECSVDVEKVNNKFNITFEEQFKRKNSIFENGRGQDLIAIIYWLENSEIKQQYLLRDLKLNPRNIFRILELFYYYALDREIGNSQLRQHLPFYKIIYETCKEEIINLNPQLTDFEKSLWEKFESLSQD